MQGGIAKDPWLKQKRFILDAVREASFVVQRSRTRDNKTKRQSNALK